MLLFDHLIHVVHNPIQAINILQRYGLKAHQGGRHDQWGTENVLCYFGLSYIEFLGIWNAARASSVRNNDLITRAYHRLHRGEGFVSIVLRTDDITSLIAHIKRQGFTVEGPVRGKRTQPDASVVKWTLAFPRCPDRKITLPFLLQWDEPDDVREIRLMRQQLISSHPIGEAHVSFVVYVVNNPRETMQVWMELFGLDVCEEKHVSQTGKTEVKLDLGNCNVIFRERRSCRCEPDNLLLTDGEPTEVGIWTDNPVRETVILGGNYRFGRVSTTTDRIV